MATRRALAWAILALLATAYSGVLAGETALQSNLNVAGAVRNPSRRSFKPLPMTPPLFKQLVVEHNQVRSQHGAAALIWNANIAASAATFVAKCNNAHDSSDLEIANLGENWYAVANTTVEDAIGAATQAWYSEISKYNFDMPGSSEGTDRFTQLVWRSSRLIGCAAQACTTLIGADIPSGVLVSCRYSPQGNVNGEYAANVLPSTSNGGSSPFPSPSPGNKTIDWLQGGYLRVEKQSLAVLTFRVKLSGGLPICPSLRVVDSWVIAGNATACPTNGYYMNTRTAPAHWGRRDPAAPPVLGSETCNSMTKVTQFVFYTFNRPLSGGTGPSNSGAVPSHWPRPPSYETSGCYEVTFYLTDGSTHTTFLKYH